MLATKIDAFETDFIGWIGKNVLTLHVSRGGDCLTQRSLGCRERWGVYYFIDKLLNYEENSVGVCGIYLPFRG